MNPLLASAIVFALCSIVCGLLWTRSRPLMSAAAVLNRAEQSDTTAIQASPSEVIYQKVRIRCAGHATERAIYRDPQRKRKPRQQHLDASDQWLKDKLLLAGVNWDEPLSAANYKEWHDQLHLKDDRVSQTGDNLLTVTTLIGVSPVMKETLTVRMNDFHPVARTVELRDQEVVEIAELNYDVMPWGAVNQDWFEPLSGQVIADSPRRYPAATAIALRSLSEQELDEAELSTRVALNRLHADTGEQILVSRLTNAVQVKGVVDTDKRKQQLEASLLQIPNVHTSLLSVEELGTHPEFQSHISNSSIQAYSVESLPSPLEQFMREKALPMDQLQPISQALLDQSRKAQQASAHLIALQRRFRVGNLPPEQRNQLTQLAQSYLQALESNIDANTRTLRSIGLGDSEPALAATGSDALDNVDWQVQRYQELCEQLVSNGTKDSLSAGVLASELKNTGALLNADAARTYASAFVAHN